MPIIEAGFYDNTGRIDHDKLIILGPTVNVTVSHHQDNQDPEIPETTLSATVAGLIDTGACQSCIDADLAENLRLPIVDVQDISGAGGKSTHNVYLAQIFIPDLKQPQFGSFTGVNLAAGGQEHKVLLGRTFLRQNIMIYDGLRGQITVISRD